MNTLDKRPRAFREYCLKSIEGSDLEVEYFLPILGLDSLVYSNLGLEIREKKLIREYIVPRFRGFCWFDKID